MIEQKDIKLRNVTSSCSSEIFYTELINLLFKQNFKDIDSAMNFMYQKVIDKEKK